MKKNNIKYFLHLLLFSIYPALFLYGHNFYDVRLFEFALPLLVLFVLALVLFLFSLVITRKIPNATLLCSFLIISFMSYGYLIDDTLNQSWWIWEYRNLIPIFILPITIYIMMRTKSDLINVTLVMNVFASSLVISSLASIGITLIGNSLSISSRSPVLNKHISAVSDANIYPDIYYLIFDRYGSAENLAKAWKFDNSNIIDFLEEKGFYVADKSLANYTHTLQSLASSLNLRYLDEVANEQGVRSENMGKLISMIQNNDVIDTLKSKGYKYVHLGSEWEATSYNIHADKNYNIYSLGSKSKRLLHILYQKSIFHSLSYGLGEETKMEKLLTGDARRIKWHRVRYIFKKLTEIPDEIPGPKFVFCHFLLPHPPYVFDRDGSYISIEEDKNLTERRKYVNQLIFTNEKIKLAVNAILNNSNPKPIIIIQADEGDIPYNYKSHRKRGIPYEHVYEKYGIFNAYYLQGEHTAKLYPSISPVNTFRLIFNLYFGSDYPLLRDEVFSSSYINIYEYHLITDKLR